MEQSDYILIKSEDLAKILHKLDAISTGRSLKYMNMNELKNYLGVSDVTVYKYIKVLGLPTVTFGGQRRFNKEDVDLWIESNNIYNK